MACRIGRDLTGCGKSPPRQFARRRGLTLVELLIAMTVMVMIVGTMEALTRAVRTSGEYSESRGTTVQHARIVLEHITRYVSEATANEHFPGFYVPVNTEGSWKFPDTLVIWNPDPDGKGVKAANPTGMPLWKELVIICPDPDPSKANRLVRIRSTHEDELPDVNAERDDVIEAIKTSADIEKVALTELLRTARVTESNPATTRGVVRFEQWDPEIASVCAGKMVLHQNWLGTELQLLPPGGEGSGDSQPIPFIGSVVLYYTGPPGTQP